VTESTFVVPGMHCEHCKAAVDNEIRAVAGVDDVAVDLDAKQVTVRGEQFRDEDVRAAIAAAGYEAA
jgi:copper chaperone